MSSDSLPPWPYSAPMPAADAFPEPDSDTERPPLKAAPTMTLPGLHAIGWSDTDDAYGPATLTPYYLEGLASPDAGDRHFAVDGLYSATTHQGSVYESSRLAIPFLAQLLSAQLEETADLACHFLSRIAIGERHFIRTPRELRIARSPCFTAVCAHRQEIETYYKHSQSDEARRLLACLGFGLPDEDVLPSDPVTLAATLVARAFIDAGRHCSASCATARSLSTTSDSLLVRGAAAYYLAITHRADEEALRLLAELAGRELPFAPWAWDDLHELAAAAWREAVPLGTLLLERGTRRGECLDEAVAREFDIGRSLPYRPEELTPSQRDIIGHVLDGDRTWLSSATLSSRGLPTSPIGFARLLGNGEGLLNLPATIDRHETARPLWCLIEEALVDLRRRDAVLGVLRGKIDPWAVAGEVFAMPPGQGEHCTLRLPAYGNTADHEAFLISLFADAVIDRQSALQQFLSEWATSITAATDGYDLAFKCPARRIGVAMLALHRMGSLEPQFHPLIRPYHACAEYSRMPLSILAELISALPAERQQALFLQMPLFTVSEGDAQERASKIMFPDAGWTLLSGCTGAWVIALIEQAAHAWENAAASGLGTAAPFPCTAAAAILRRNHAPPALMRRVLLGHTSS